MKTLDAIYKEYQRERTREVEELLVARIEKLAGIIMHQFRVYKSDPYFEEYMQSAYLLFFELLASFDPEKGKLEGYFVVSWKFSLITLIKKRMMKRKEHRRLLSEDLLDESTPYNTTLVSNLVDKLWDVADNSERIVLGYLLVGENNPERIGELEDTPAIDVEYVIESLRVKAEDTIFEGGEHIL
jgi:hypothetical protein